MICAYEMIDGILRIRFPEVITSKELVKLNEELSSVEKAYAIIPHRLSDFRPITSADVNFDYMFSFAKHRAARIFSNSFRSALLVGNSYQFGLARMFQTLNDNKSIEIEIFYEESKALDWIRSTKAD